MKKMKLFTDLLKKGTKGLVEECDKTFKAESKFYREDVFGLPPKPSKNYIDKVKKESSQSTEKNR